MADKASSRRGKNTIRIVLVDDHPIVREGLAQLINCEKDLHVCGQAEGAPEALAVIGKLQPDVAIVDLSLRDGNGLDLIKDLRSRHPRVKTLVLSMHDASVYAERALRAGARGYIMKEEGTKRVIDGIRHLMTGEIYIGENTSQRILARLAGTVNEARTPSINALSDRELEVLRLLGEGLGIRAIAEKLHRSAKTIETHRENIKNKLGLPSARDVLQYAIRWAQSENL